MDRLLEYFTPENYQLSLNINKHTKELIGTALITGFAKAKNIKLHAEGLSVDKVLVDGKKVDFSHENGLISLVVAPRSDLTLEIGYHRALNENMQGAYLSTYKYQGKEERIVSTQFESHYARECFPCIDEPAAKATFDLSITVPDKDDIVVANTPVKSREDNTIIFETTPRMSTYLLAFVIGKFQSKTIKNTHGVTITTYIPLNQDAATIDFANDIAAKSLDYYDNIFGSPYPLPKLDQVAIPDFEAGAMENWGLVTYREVCLLAAPDSTLDAKKSVALTIAHELSHQWFGDLVTMAWWDDLWLNESFASVMEYYAVDFIHKEYNIWEDFFTGDCLAAFRRDALPGVQAVQQEVHNPAEIATLFDSAIVYAKGAHLMLMLIRAMTLRRFLAGVKEYFKKHAYGNTTGDDLWAALQSHADFNVKDFMHAWISQPGYPVITDDSAQRFLIDGSSDGTTWPLQNVTNDMSGHYLINLSGPEFADALANFSKLSLEQRLRLLIDRMLLAKTPIVSSASLLDLIPKFKNETSAAIWEIIMFIIGDLKLFFPYKSAEEAKFKAYLSDFIQPSLARLGITPKPGEDSNDTRIRGFVLGLAYYIEDTGTLEALAKLYRADYSKINAEIRQIVLSAKLHLDETVFDEYLEKYQKFSDPEVKFDLLAALTNAKSKENTEKLIKLLSEPKIVRPQDHMYLYMFLCRNHETKDRAVDWLFSHWDYLREIAGDKYLEFYPRRTASIIKTTEEAEAFFNFFDKIADDPAISRTLKVARADIYARISLINFDRKAVFAHLK